MPKRLIWAAVILFLLALDWAALHDILRGESNPVLEWTMLAVSAPWCFFAVRRLIRG